MKQGLVALALILLACGTLAQTCRFTDSVNGCEYDFSSLTLNQAPYYEFNDTDASAAGFYEVNICAPVANASCAATSGVCQTANGDSYNCGNAGNNFAALASAVPGTCNGAVLTYSDGTFCPGVGSSRQTNITIKCNAAVTTPNITSISEIPGTCVYLIEMESSAACGTTVAIPTPSASASISVVAPPVASPSASASASISVVVPPVASPSASSSASASMSVIASAGNGTNTNSTSPTVSMSVSASASISLISGNSTTNSTNNGTSSNSTAESSSGGGNGWIWWVVGGIAIVVVVAAVGAAGFVVYKKKQQSYDSIGYE